MGLVILITGANRGLGYSLAKILLRKGNTIITLNRNVSESLKTLKKEYSQNLFLFNVDVTEENEIKEAKVKIKEITSFIDILINNAAIHLEKHKPDISDINFESISRTFEVNSIGPLKIAKYFIPMVKKGAEKIIVNISSEAGSISNQIWRKSEFGYCMSKSALNMMSKILQNRLKKDAIKVLAIHPQWFSSDMGGLEAPITPDEAASYVVNNILEKWSLDDPIFIDSKTRNPIEW